METAHTTSTPGDSAVVLFSGGQDSTTCLFWALERFDSVRALGFDYGQKHGVEVEQAETIAEKAGVPYDLVDMEGVLEGSALTEHEKAVDTAHEQDEDLPATFVPGRNALFLSAAASYAYNREITDLVGGMCQTDFSGYPDCRRVFIDSMETSLSLALDVDVRIHTPLMYRTKAETWKLAADLGTVAGQDVLEVVRRDSHTDYRGNRETFHEWGYGELDNEASRLRAKGYKEAKEKGWV